MNIKKTKLLRRRGVLIACLTIGAAALWAPTAQTSAHHGGPGGQHGRSGGQHGRSGGQHGRPGGHHGAGNGAVYVQSNSEPFNTVLVFNRNHDGTLTAAGSVMTGGVGQPTGNPPGGIPFIDTAGSVTLSHNGRFLLVVNAGDNTVSSFRVTGHGLRLANVVPSFGERPASVTVHHHLVYVLNSDTGSASISGYRLGGNGHLTPIPGSVQPTTSPADGLPAQIQFDAKGKVLAVSERFAGGSGDIDTFAIGHNGAAEPGVAHPSQDVTPYGIAFTHKNVMIVSNEHAPDGIGSSVSSYNVSHHGAVTPIETEPTNSGAACWNVITKNDKYVLITSPFTLQINSFRIEHNGQLTPVNGDSIVATAQGVTLDESLSRNSKYLYVLVDEPTGFAYSQLNSYKVNGDGTITLLGTTDPFGFGGSSSGTAAW